MKTVLITLFLAGSCICSYAQWTRINSKTTEDLTAVSFVDSNTGFACGAYNTLLKTSNGGSSWQVIPNSGVPVVSYMSVHAMDANRVLVARNGLYASDNGGASFTQWGGLDTAAYSIQNIKAINDSTVVITKGGYVLRTTSKGASWSNVYYNQHLAGRMVFTGDTAYVASGITFDATSVGSIHKSVDGGASWYDLNLGSRQVTAMYFRNATTGYYVEYGNNLYKTIDGGATWSLLGRVVDSASDYITDILFLNDAVGYATTIAGYIYKTSNGGTSWSVDHQASTTAGAALTALVKLSELQVVAVGNGGTILKMGKTLSTKDVELSMLSVYPNPANSHINVAFGNTAGQYKYLELYDALGAMVLQQEVNGKATHSFDVGGLSKGLYVLKASGPSGTAEQKLIIQ